MPLDYDKDDEISFTPYDFLYGLDTGSTRPRAYFWQNIAGPLKASGQIWHGHHVDSHKIDCLTQGLGTKPPEQIVAMSKQVLTTELLEKWRTASASGTLKDGWETRGTKQKIDFRIQDQLDYLDWIKDTRYSPGLSAKPEEWNARFKRTSKAGLFWALFVKGYKIHFIVHSNIDYDEVVKGSKSHAEYVPFTKRYGKSDEEDVVEVEEKRITWAEMRWVYRYQDYAAVARNVQFWEMADAHEARAIKAPWLDVRFSAHWQGYQPKFDKKNGDDDMSNFLKSLDKNFMPKEPRPVTNVFEKDGKLDIIDTILFKVD